MATVSLIFCIIAAYYTIGSEAFVSSTRRGRSSTTFKDGKLSENQDRNKGYGPLGSLTRQGPVPFFIRLSQPDTYEAAVNKYMLLEKCDRMTAQGYSFRNSTAAE